MDIVGKVIIEKHRDGVLIERRETKNLLRDRGARVFALLGWNAPVSTRCSEFELSLISGGITYIQHITRLVLANADKTTIKWFDSYSLSREDDPTAMKWVVTMTWVDTSTDSYTVYYIGLLSVRDAPSVGADNITGSPDSLFAARIDPPVTKASEETLSIRWVIEIPYGEVS